ncbi:MAG: AbrB/MazE/SpoVT family DNA-binding domain-containing protein [Armatimonadetes bacterium]|nr:AbrB/MazE/SpoVT family DNA-binding domain-containing protein [Armatimonadota bacterium]
MAEGISGHMFFGAVTVGERGQIVIPAEARRTLDIRPGEKLLVFAPPGHKGLMVVKVEDILRFTESLREFLSAVEKQETSEESVGDEEE